MSKIRFLFACLSASLLMCNSCTSKLQKDEFELRGTIKGLQEKSELVLVHQDFRTGVMDTVAKDDVYKAQFQMKGKVVEPSLYILLSNDLQKGIPLFIEPGKMIVTGELQDLSKIHMSGSKSHDDFSALQDKISTIYKKQENWYKAAELAMMAGNQSQVDSFNKLMEKSVPEIEDAIFNHGSSNVNSFSFPLMVLQNVYYLDPLKYMPVFEKLDEKVKNSEFGKVLKEKLDVLAKTSPGQIAPDIKGMSPDGVEIGLSSFRGHVTLIDFWASWCGPCRSANPEIVNTYVKFKDKGFKILGISLDENREAWSAAIQEDGLTWNHVSDLKGWKSPIAEQYGVQAIPQSILIDIDGKIIGRNLSNTELNTKLLTLLP